MCFKAVSKRFPTSDSVISHFRGFQNFPNRGFSFLVIRSVDLFPSSIAVSLGFPGHAWAWLSVAWLLRWPG